MLSPWVIISPPMTRVDMPQLVSNGGAELVLPVGEGDAEGLGEAVAEVVAGAGLERLVSCIMHSMV